MNKVYPVMRSRIKKIEWFLLLVVFEFVMGIKKCCGLGIFLSQIRICTFVHSRSEHFSFWTMAPKNKKREEK
jgi:hypothetical protein